MTRSKNWVWALIAVLPALITALAIGYDAQYRIGLPVPFLILIISVSFSGVMGGRWAGSIAGIFAALCIARSYQLGFGPPPLTGGLTQTVIAMILYAANGLFLGLIHDLRAKKLATVLRKTAQETINLAKELEHSEAKLKQALNVAKIGFWIWDMKSDRCEYSSDINAAIFGLTPEEYIEACHSTPEGISLVHPEDRQAYLQAMDKVEDGTTITHEYQGLKKSGGTTIIRETLAPLFDDDGQIDKMLGTSIDVTLMRRAEKQSRQAQKMAAIGRLTAGVAHDFNNLLAVILQNLELISDEIDDSQVGEKVKSAVRATKQGTCLAQQLLAFGRQSALNPEILDPNEIIEKLQPRLRRTFPATIQVDYELSEDIWPIKIDSGQFENAIMSLVINAKDAMPDSGKFKIASRNITKFDKSDALMPEDIEPGYYVLIEFSDTGTGMSPETLEHVMEPFFTTKPSGEGSGLGLAMVYGFVKQSGGTVQVQSEAGQGTKVMLYFKEASATGPIEEHQQEAPNDPVAASENILVVDDNDSVRMIVTTQLKHHGYNVITASNAADALSLFQSGRQIDLLLSDVVMPGGMQGTSLAEKIQNDYPSTKIILATGHSKGSGEMADKNIENFLTLAKPMQMTDLLTTIRRELDRA